MDVPEIVGGGVLGEKIVGDRRQLDVFMLAKGVKTVTYTSDEVTSLCPLTGQPDFYEVEIYIYNTHYGLESKSIKLYLKSFREDGQFCEQFAATIAKDVLEVIDIDLPKGIGGPIMYPEVDVKVTQKPRGGVSIIATANAHREGAL